MVRPFPLPASGPAVELFAIEDTSAQLVWSGVGAGTLDPVSVQVEATPTTPAHSLNAPGAPVGAINLAGMNPGAKHRVTVSLPRAGGPPTHVHVPVHTLPAPPGPELFRFATVNDTHLGDRSFGRLPRLREPYVAGRDPFPLRCLRAALDEALQWGAQAIVVKGDLTALGRPLELDAVADLLTALPVPVHVLLGNHDTVFGWKVPVARLARRGIEAAVEPVAVDYPGIRLVLLPTISLPSGTAILADHWTSATASLVGEAAGGAFVGLHHYPQRFRYPVMWPPGIAWPMSARLLDAIAEANPATLVATGHSHRHRRHHHGPLTVAEIGSTKDYPGAWAGYAVHTGGIRQVVRRVARPDAIAWTQHTKSTLFGIWGMWSPGVRSHRCFSLEWPKR